MGKTRQFYGVILGIIFLSPLHTWAQNFAGGTGQPDDPYQISTAEQLVSIGADPN